MIPFITEETVRRTLDEKTAFILTQEAFRLLAQKRAAMPPKVYLPLPAGDDFRAMPAYFLKSEKTGACGIKWVCVFPGNPKRRKPTVMGTILLNSFETGELLAVIEANTITAMRTAGAAAVATHYLANPAPRKLAIVGAGLQATYQLRAIAALYRFKEIAVWGFMKGEAAAFRGRLKKEFPVLSAADDVESCVRDADIIVTCTPSRRPLVKSAWVKEGAHINAIGADAKGKEELEPALVLRSKVIVDEWEQASHSGEINVPVEKGFFTRRNLHAELSEVVSGSKPGRANRREITLFDSTGLAILDIRFADHVFRARNKKNN